MNHESASAFIQQLRRSEADLVMYLETKQRVYDDQDVPGLSDADPSAFAVSVVSVSGQCISLSSGGTSANSKFLTRSTFKPLVFAFALKHLGREQVAALVANTGCKGYRAATLEADGRAHNPLINSGALAVMQRLHAAGYSVDDVVQFVSAAAGPASCRCI